MTPDAAPKAELRTRRPGAPRRLAGLGAGALLRTADRARAPRSRCVHVAGASSRPFIPCATSPTRWRCSARWRRGLGTALPVTGARGEPLVFRRWRPGEPTVPGQMRIPEPLPEAPALDPDLLFVPLAAFDRRGHRIGYGAGHYDCTLARLKAQKPIVAVGVAYGVSRGRGGARRTARPAARLRPDRFRTHRSEGRLMRLLFVGDVVGRARPRGGRSSICRTCARAGGSTSSSSTARTPPAASASPRRSSSEFLEAGADAVTLGNHAFDQSEALTFIERQPRLLRPVNYPAGRAGARRGGGGIAAAARARWSSI